MAEESRGGALARLTGSDNYFEDFAVGEVFEHARGKTVTDLEGHLLTNLVQNTAQAHFNEEYARTTPFGRRVVFGGVTTAIVLGLASQDTGENALEECGLSAIRLPASVFHGDTLTAFSEVLEKADAKRPDAGVVRFKHWGVNQQGEIVFEGERTVLMKRRSHWGGR